MSVQADFDEYHFHVFKKKPADFTKNANCREWLIDYIERLRSAKPSRVCITHSDVKRYWSGLGMERPFGYEEELDG